MLYSQEPVEYLYVNISIQDVNYAGYIVNSDSKISEVLLRKYMNNDSLFCAKFIAQMKQDSFILITPELTNCLRFTNPIAGVYYIYDFRKISKKNITDILLLDVIRFWPWKIELSGKEPENPPCINENSKMISFGEFNGKDYILYSKSGNDISEKNINELKTIIKKSKLDEKRLEEKLNKCNLVLVSYLTK